MNILLCPLNCFGAVHRDDNDLIFINENCKLSEMIDTLKHEFAHIICGNPFHDEEWYEIYKNIGGKKPFKSIYFRDVGNVTWIQNVGNVTGIQNILMDYHLLQAYRKFSQRILGTEGQWEVKGDNKIRLFPTPRGSFPVVVEYMPIVTRFRSPQAKEITKRALVAEAKIMIGNARSKFGNIPAPGGGSMSLNGEQMRTEGQQEKQQAVQDAILHSEPLGPILW